MNIVKPFLQDFNENEIFFISDIEYFTEEIKKEMYETLKNKKIKLVVFLGDILSFLEQFQDAINLLYNPKLIVDIFFSKIDNDHNSDIETQRVGRFISDYIQKQIKDNDKFKEPVKNYIDFVRYCKRKNINILYYSGNHDSIMGTEIRYYSEQIPILKKLWEYDNLYIPYDDLEHIQLNKNLFIIGLHTHSDESNCNEYPELKTFVNSLRIREIENPEETILVSHIPGKKNFSNLGSEEITLLKKTIKFKCHYHGHCNHYHNGYIEEGVLTKSVHYQRPENP